MRTHNDDKIVVVMDSDAAERMAKLERAVERDGRYPLAAFEFLHKGLQHATQLAHGTAPLFDDDPHHVSGRELCLALRDLATQIWGGMAFSVLTSWNIRTTRDFGEMVFFLVQLNLLGAQESDRIEDFENVYDLRDAFTTYRIPLDPDDEIAED